MFSLVDFLGFQNKPKTFSLYSTVSPPPTQLAEGVSQSIVVGLSMETMITIESTRIVYITDQIEIYNHSHSHSCVLYSMLYIIRVRRNSQLVFNQSHV